MPLASSYSYPLLGAFWTILEIFLWVLWIWILIYVFIDIFRSHDLSGWAKALWFIFVLFIPLIGVLDVAAELPVLLLRLLLGALLHAAAPGDQVDQDAAGSGNTADQLTKLAELRDRGVITADEFERQKAKVLAS